MMLTYEYHTDSPTTDDTEAETVDPADDDDSESTIDLKKQMEMVMHESMTPTPRVPFVNSNQDNSKALTNAIKAEMAVFANSARRGRNLETIYDYLMSIPPTSVEAERAFSAAGALCTKMRSRLSDKTLDMLCFLRYYYRRRN